MSTKANKGRITITCSEEQIAKLDVYSSKMGMNRSALCALFIGQGLIGMDKTFGIMDKITDDITERLGKSFDVMPGGNQ